MRAARALAKWPSRALRHSFPRLQPLAERRGQFGSPLEDPLCARIMGEVPVLSKTFESLGEIKVVGDGYCIVTGMPKARPNTVVVLPDGTNGVVLKVSENLTTIGQLEHSNLKRGTRIPLFQQPKVPQLPSCVVGGGTIGRVLSPLGLPLDGLSPVKESAFRVPLVDRPNLHWTKVRTDHCSKSAGRWTSDREPIFTGLKAVDAFHPLCKGNRTAIIGTSDMRKSELAVDMVLRFQENNLKSKNTERMHCVYVMVGKNEMHARELMTILEGSGAMEYTTVIRADEKEPPLIQHYAPYAGMLAADFYRNNGMHSFIVYDNLSAHNRVTARFMREARGMLHYGNWYGELLECSNHLTDDHGGGSMTSIAIADYEDDRDQTLYFFLPVLQSHVDGHFLLTKESIAEGVLPGINTIPPASTGVRGYQPPALRYVVQEVRKVIQFNLEAQKAAQAAKEVGIEVDLDEEDAAENIQKVRLVFSQGSYCEIPDLVIQIYAASHDYLRLVHRRKMSNFEERLLKFHKSSTRMQETYATIDRLVWSDDYKEVLPHLKLYLDEFFKENPDLEYVDEILLQAKRENRL